MRHRLELRQRPSTFGLDRCAKEMNWCHAGRYLFARSRHGSTTSTQSRNSTGHPIDWPISSLTSVKNERVEGVVGDRARAPTRSHYPRKRRWLPSRYSMRAIAGSSFAAFERYRYVDYGEKNEAEAPDVRLRDY